MSNIEEKLTRLKHLKLLAERINSDFASKTSVAGLTQKMDEAAAVSRNIANSMYQAPTYTKYSTTIEPVTSGTGSITGYTVGALLGDEKLAGLTSAGTDDEGNNKYALIINDVTIDVYTKNAVLSDIMSDINSNEQAAVGVSYSETENRFTFTARRAGAGVEITFDSGLASALFDAAKSVDGSAVKFVTLYGVDWLGDDESAKLSFAVLGNSSKHEINITKDASLEDVVSALNGSPLGSKNAFSYNKYTGQIEARGKESGARKELEITDITFDDFQAPVEFDESKAPVSPYTYGKDAIFFAVKVNGALQPVAERTVNITVPTVDVAADAEAAKMLAEIFGAEG